MEKLDLILTVASDETGVSDELILGMTRLKPVVLARHLTMFVMYETGCFSLNDIGTFLGRDHASVIHGIQRIRLSMVGGSTAARALKARMERLRQQAVDIVQAPRQQHGAGFMQLKTMPSYELDLEEAELNWLESLRGSYVSYLVKLESYLVQASDLVNDANSGITTLGGSERLTRLLVLEAPNNQLVSITLGGS